MSDTVISVENLSKLYRIGRAEQRRESLIAELGSLLSAPIRNFRSLRGLDTLRCNGNGHGDDAPDLLWALRDLSFEVKRGDILGVVGRNGAGKSTLLKILSRITEPSRGRVRICGRVASLLEVGTGFHPELTGRQNVYLNGTVLGMSRREIDRKFDEIVEFSGVSKFLDTPVKRYSSGMKVRLGFAVAAHLEPDILIVDEVLAVGDFEFQKKCIGKMQDVTRQGDRTILFVSHNMGAVRSLCSRAIVLEHGQLVSDGDPEEQISAYYGRLAEQSSRPIALRSDFQGSGRTRVTDIRLLDGNGQAVLDLHVGDPLRVVISYESEQAGAVPEVAMSWFSADGQKTFHVDSNLRAARVGPLESSGEFVCEVGRLPVVPGWYHINVQIKVRGELEYHLASAMTLTVSDGDYYGTGRVSSPQGGVFFLDHDWTLGVGAAGKEEAVR